jgi:hypothetical protein
LIWRNVDEGEIKMKMKIWRDKELWEKREDLD